MWSKLTWLQNPSNGTSVINTFKALAWRPLGAANDSRNVSYSSETISIGCALRYNVSEELRAWWNPGYVVRGDPPKWRSLGDKADTYTCYMLRSESRGSFYLYWPSMVNSSQLGDLSTAWSKSSAYPKCSWGDSDQPATLGSILRSSTAPSSTAASGTARFTVRSSQSIIPYLSRATGQWGNDLLFELAGGSRVNSSGFYWWLARPTSYTPPSGTHGLYFVDSS